MDGFDHPIFTESLRRIHGWLEPTGLLDSLTTLEQEVVERLVHSSGDLSVASGVRFSPGACAQGLDSLLAGGRDPDRHGHGGGGRGADGAANPWRGRVLRARLGACQGS